MAGKTEYIHCRLGNDPQGRSRKKKLRDKAKKANCKDLTAFLEKVADDDIIFLDPNAKTLLNALGGALTTQS